MESGSIITVIAYDDENQPFEFTGKISAINDDNIIMSVVYGNAMEHQNSPFQESEPEPEPDLNETAIELMLVEQFLKYRRQGFDIEKCLKWIEQDNEFIYEKF